MHTDVEFMQRAILMAKRGFGKTSPNPIVGCVIVKNGRIIAEGWHKCYGHDHAEVDALKKAGVLSHNNRTDPTKGLFESDTGQLLLNAPSRQLRVITPRLEGACLDPATMPGRLTLGQLTIESTSVPASVTAIAVDDRPLVESRRILLVYATDALNSGMTFPSVERETLVTLGRAPALLRTGQIKMALTGRHVAAMKLWALGLDGRRRESLAVIANGDSLSVMIDTSQLKSATSFFEAVAE